MSLLSGLISNAKDNLEKFYRMVAENGSLTWLKTQLADLNAEFNRMACRWLVAAMGQEYIRWRGECR